MSATVGEILATLQEMGFSKERAETALTKTGWKGVEPAMEWLLAHPEGEAVGDSDEDAEMEKEEEEEKPAPPKKAELTAEEKAEQLKRLEELRVQKRIEREAREAKEALEKEKRMRQEGKALTSLKQELADKELLRNAEERRREKKETELAREKVRAQIEADRKARREEEARRRGEVVETPTQQPLAQQQSATAAAKVDYSQTRLQVRLPDGSTLVNSFQAKETLSAVRLFVELNRKDGCSGLPRLMTSFPKKVFDEEDYEKPLEALGLVPSAVLIVSK